MKITADYAYLTGPVKPMHGVGQPPFLGANFSLFHYLTEASIPYSRLHDVGGWLGHDLYVDVPNLFRDFDADENDPASYDFVFTDRMLKALCDAKVEPFFRLGVTIENSWALKSYRVFPPKDPAKWARICEHIVRHYNEGWADGYHMGITYWEIWNEPDNWEEPGSPMWQGTPEQYFELYEVTAKHLKACFGDSIKVGGFASCGFYALDTDPDYDGNLRISENPDAWERRITFFIEFMHGFFRHITSEEHKAPIDFFSWHSYADVFSAVKQAKYIRKVMEYYGLGDVPDVLDEWNTLHHILGRATPKAAANCLAFMLAMQNETVSEMNYYDARLGPSEYGGLFNPSTWEPYLAYYAFAAFGQAYRLGNAVKTASDNDHVFTLGATNGKKSVLLIANVGAAVTAQLELSGVDLSAADVVRIDGVRSYALTGESLANGTIRLPEDSCVEIRF